MLTLNKYELNRLDSYCKFKKYEKIRLISSVFILSIYITMCHGIYMNRPANDTIPVTESQASDTIRVGNCLSITRRSAEQMAKIFDFVLSHHTISSTKDISSQLHNYTR